MKIQARLRVTSKFNQKKIEVSEFIIHPTCFRQQIRVNFGINFSFLLSLFSILEASMGEKQLESGGVKLKYEMGWKSVRSASGSAKSDSLSTHSGLVPIAPEYFLLPQNTAFIAQSILRCQHYHVLESLCGQKYISPQYCLKGCKHQSHMAHLLPLPLFHLHEIIAFFAFVFI